MCIYIYIYTYVCVYIYIYLCIHTYDTLQYNILDYNLVLDLGATRSLRRSQLLQASKYASGNACIWYCIERAVWGAVSRLFWTATPEDGGLWLQHFTCTAGLTSDQTLLTRVPRQNKSNKEIYNTI